MRQYLHGGNHPGMMEFSANLNPLGTPLEVKQAIIDAVDHIQNYPDPHCDKLRKALANHYKVDADSIVCTAGASDAIMRICQATKPKQALVSAPCFSGYEKSLDAVGCKIRRFQLLEKDSFDFSLDFAQHIGPQTDIVFVCSPNNPTGRIIDPSLIEAFANRAQAHDALLVIDESFLDFTDNPSSAYLTQNLDNVIILGSFTKMYAMAGVRLGYVICRSEDIRCQLDLVGMDWAVSTTAQEAGLAAMGLSRFREKTRRYVSAQRSYLTESLRKEGIRVVDGSANYLLIQSRPDLAKMLASKGIAIRTCSDYHGLDGTWFRIAVRTKDENDTLINAIREATHDR